MTEISDTEAREQAVSEREAANESRTAELAEQALALAKHEAHLEEVEARQEATARDLKDFESALEEQAAEQGEAVRTAATARPAARPVTPPLVPGTNLAGLRRTFDPDVVMARRSKQIAEHTAKVNEDRQRGIEKQKADADPKRTGRHKPNTSPYA